MRATLRADSRASRRRLRRAVLLAVVACGAWAPATQAAGMLPYDEAGYLAYADRMQERLDPLWDEDAGRYRAGGGGTEPMINALLLLAHSVAAQQGHDGPSRNEARARRVAL